MVVIHKYDNNGEVVITTDCMSIECFKKCCANAIEIYKKEVGVEDWEHDYGWIKSHYDGVLRAMLKLKISEKILSDLRKGFEGCTIIFRSGSEEIGSSLRTQPVIRSTIRCESNSGPYDQNRLSNLT